MTKGVFMKVLMTMLVLMLVFVGCSDSGEPAVLTQEQEVVSDVAEEADVEVAVDDVDSVGDVSTLEVEQQEEDTETQPDASEAP